MKNTFFFNLHYLLEFQGNNFFANRLMKTMMEEGNSSNGANKKGYPL